MTNAMRAIERMLAEDRIVLLDGATGTELQRRGAAMNDVAWCALATASHPELLRAIHEDYVRAGCEVVTANTFASARHLLERAGHGAGHASCSAGRSRSRARRFSRLRTGR